MSINREIDKETQFLSKASLANYGLWVKSNWLLSVLYSPAKNVSSFLNVWKIIKRNVCEARKLYKVQISISIGKVFLQHMYKRNKKLRIPKCHLRSTKKHWAWGGGVLGFCCFKASKWLCNPSWELVIQFSLCAGENYQAFEVDEKTGNMLGLQFIVNQTETSRQMLPAALGS